MKISLSTDTITKIKTEVIACGVHARALKKDKVVGQLDRLCGGTLRRVAADEGFKAKRGQVLSVQVPGKSRLRRVILVGLGNAKPHASQARSTAVRAARLARRFGSLAVVVSDAQEANVRAAGEGIVGGAYGYDRFISDANRSKNKLARALVVVEKSASSKDLGRALEEGAAIGGAVNFARDLVNCPSNELTPSALAESAKQAAQQVGIDCKVFDKKEIERRGMNLLLAVNRGSAQEPRFVHMTYKPKDAKKRVVFVGKGITFDSGGLCLKPSKGMADMKCDMAGAATTIAILVSAAILRLPIEVHGVIACTENMTGGDAFRPGDVFAAMNGKTVEIVNTDAEGRLILADALCYANDLEPDVLIDHATLTGACMVALGPRRAGLYSNTDALADAYAEVASNENEMMWRMPLDMDLRDALKSSVADIRHCDGPYGGSITAALFLKEFVGKNTWAHVDIAGPAFLDHAHGDNPKGGTGFGVRTAVEYLRSNVTK